MNDKEVYERGIAAGRKEIQALFQPHVDLCNYEEVTDSLCDVCHWIRDMNEYIEETPATIDNLIESERSRISAQLNALLKQRQFKASRHGEVANEFFSVHEVAEAIWDEQK